ncbi:MAG TPA: electron transfer flavoprotein subunit alpha/FixB family protein, partial [Xanthomonadales bacterium]|nr:electron transfer flavoprotein subunit alpha/FixB family protein [Xanthomonadales bacterium]
MSKILIIAEHDGSALNLSTAKTLSCASAVGGEIDIAVLGKGVDAVAAQAAALAGVKSVLKIEADHLEHVLAENWAPEIAALAAGYSHV